MTFDEWKASEAERRRVTEQQERAAHHVAQVLIPAYRERAGSDDEMRMWVQTAVDVAIRRAVSAERERWLREVAAERRAEPDSSGRADDDVLGWNAALDLVEHIIRKGGAA